MSQPTPKNRVLFVRRLAPALLLFFGVFSVLALNLRTPKLALAATNSTINFQARLESSSGAIAPDGTYNVEFKLYNASTSSGSSQGSCTGDANCLWTETRTGAAKVQVTNGYLTVNLGSVTSFPTTINWDQQLWLTMNIGGAGSPSWDGEMNPRLTLTGVPYAFSAGQLQTTSGSYTNTLNIQAPTGGSQIFQIQNQGAAGTYNLLTAPSGSDGYIKLQGGTPGTAQTGSFNINGTGIASTINATTALQTNGVTRIDSTGAFLNSSGLSLLSSSGVLSNIASFNSDVLGSNTLTFSGASPTISATGTNNSLTLQSAGTGAINLTGNTNITAGSGTTTIQGGGLDIIDFNKAGGTNVAKIDLNGNLSAKNGNFTTSSGTGGSGVTVTSSNLSTLSTTQIQNGLSVTLSITPFGTNNNANSNTCSGNPNGACNINNAINLQNAIAVTGNNFNGIYAGNNYNSILMYDNNGSPISLINGSGILQNAALASSYTAITSLANLTTVGALTSGSINWSGAIATSGNISTSGSGTISSASTITGTSLNGTTGINTGAGAGTQRIDVSGNFSGGTINTDTLSSSALTFSGAAGTVSATGTNSSLTLQASGTGTIALSGNSTVTGTFNSGSSNQFQVDASGNIITSGSITGSSHDTTAGGTLSLGSTYAATINVGGGSSAQTLNIGNGGGNDTLNIATGAGTDTINIGNSGDGVNIFANLTANGTSNNIGATGATVTSSTTNISNSTDSSSTQTVSIGSSANSASTTTLQGGGASLVLGNNSATVQSLTNSSTAFQVENSAGVPVFLVDTADTISSNLLTNGGFELGTVGSTPTSWSTVVPSGTVTAVKNTTAPYHYGGLASANVTMSGVSGQGISTNSFTSTPASSTQYTVSFYAESVSGLTASTNYSVSFNGGTATACSSGVTLTTNGFQRIICTVTTPAAAVTSMAITINAATATQLYIDAVQLTLGSGAKAATNGEIQLRGDIASPVVFQALSNSTTAFQINNSNGAAIFVADTASNNNLISNFGFETGTTGWANGTNGTIAQNTNKANTYGGQGSALVSITTGGGNVTVTGFTTNLTPGSYNFSFYAEAGSSTTSPTVTITGGSAPACTVTAVAMVATGFQRYSCSFTSTTTNVTAINIVNAATGTFYIDAAQLVNGATLQAYYATGTLQLRGAITSPAIFQSVSNSTTAFQINGASGTSIFNADTVNSQLTLAGNTLTATALTFSGASPVITASTTNTALTLKANGTGLLTLGQSTGNTSIFGLSYSTSTGGVIIGGAGTTANPVLLNLNKSSISSAETAANCTSSVNQGALYYNTVTNAIRACINANWEDVVTTSGLGIIMFGVVPDSGSTNPGDLTASAQTTTGVSGPCKVTVGSTTATITWTSCVAYSGGRKVVVTAGTTTFAGAASSFQNLCLATTAGALDYSGTPHLVNTANTTETTATLFPTFSVSSPILCLATIKGGSTANTIGAIYDTRAYTTDTKTFATVSTATGLGSIVKSTGTGAVGQYTPTTTATDPVLGVTVAFSGTAGTGAPNAIVVTNGPIAAKVTAAGTIGNFLQTSTTAGFGQMSGTAASSYANLGIALTNYSGLTGSNCAINTICSGSVFANLNIK